MHFKVCREKLGNGVANITRVIWVFPYIVFHKIGGVVLTIQT